MRAVLLTAMAVASSAAGACTARPEAPVQLYVASSAGPAMEALARRGDLPAAVVIAGASDRLALQIDQGAPATLFLSASEEVASGIAARHQVPRYTRVWCDELAVLVREDNAAMDWRRALASPRIGLAERSVPVGVYSAAALEQLAELEGHAWLESLERRAGARETSARTLLTRLRLGEVDAVLGYRSQGVSADGVRALPLPIRVPTALHLVQLAATPSATAWVGAALEDTAFWQAWGYAPCPSDAPSRAPAGEGSAR